MPDEVPISPVRPPTIHKVTGLGVEGEVYKGNCITQSEAEARRRLGLDVVVCGESIRVNRLLARAIEQAANGKYKLCPPHLGSGRFALPHFQPDPRPPLGHTFYETPNRKAC